MNAGKSLFQDSKLKLATWNIRTLIGKGVAETIFWRRTSITCFQKTKWVGKRSKEIEDTRYRIWFRGKEKNRNRIKIILKKLVDFKRQCDRIIEKTCSKKEMLTIVLHVRASGTRSTYKERILGTTQYKMNRRETHRRRLKTPYR